MTENSIPESAAVVANAVVESVQYQGRKASRRGSEQRRQNILDAAMRLIVREGVRAVRHRAVAAEAQVPLSATTYYFKDINDLITDTFTQFVERSAAHMGQLWSQTEENLQNLSQKLDGSVQSRRQLADEIARLAVEYVYQQLHQRRDHLIAQRAFEQEALINPRLHDLVCAHRKILLQGASRFFEALSSEQPQHDAEVLTALLLRMEYQGLIDGVERLDSADMLARLKRYMYLVLGL